MVLFLFCSRQLLTVFLDVLIEISSQKTRRHRSRLIYCKQRGNELQRLLSFGKELGFRFAVQNKV